MILNYDGIVFDIDGTLWDTAEMCALGWNAALAKTPYPERFNREDLAGIMGLKPDDTRRKLLGFVDETTGNELLRLCFLEEVRELEKNGAQALYPGVRETLAQLARHYSLHLVSNCESEYLKVFLDVNQFDPFFRGRRCYGHHAVSKGENLAYLVQEQSLKRPLYVGDTQGDLEAAQFAGVPFLWARYGFGSPLGWTPSVKAFPDILPHLLPKK